MPTQAENFETLRVALHAAVDNVLTAIQTLQAQAAAGMTQAQCEAALAGLQAEVARLQAP